MEKSTSQMPIKVGDIYRLRFPGVAARVIEPPHELRMAPRGYPILVESLFCRVRWYINERGEGSHTPQVLIDRKVNVKDVIVTIVLALFVAVGVPCALWIDNWVHSRLGF